MQLRTGRTNLTFMLRQTCSLILAASLLTLAGCGKPKPAGPDETAKTFAKGISDKKPEVIWELLPASYQTDLNGLVAAAAAKTDPDLHAKTVETLKRLVTVLKTKKEYILGSPMLKEVPNINQAELQKNYDSAVGMIDTLVASDLSNLDKMKKPDLGNFLKETGGKLMAQAAAVSAATPDDEMNKELAKLSQLQAKVLTQTDTTAEMDVTVDGKTEKVKLTKVEDKWVPDDMAKEWAEKMAEARKGVDGMKMAEGKMQILAMLGAASTVLEQLEKTKSQEEFDQLLTSSLQGMM